MAVVVHDDLPLIRKRHRSQKIVFCSGTFDLTHPGHVLFFEACRKLGDVLVVGVGQDVEIKKHKGKNRPIQSERVRLKMVDSLKPVDYVFLTEPTAPGDSMVAPLERVFVLLQPNFWVVNYDAPEISVRQELARKYDLPLEILNLDRECREYDGISTSGLIRMIRELPPD